MRPWKIMTLALMATGWGGGLLAPPLELVPGKEGVEAFDEFHETGGLGPGEEILGMVGFGGQSIPDEWLFLTGKPDQSGAGLRESVFVRGRVLSERTLVATAGQDLPRLPIDRKRLKVTSAGAYRIAVAKGEENRVSFESVHFQLRVRDAGKEPVWLLRFVNRAQVGVGVVYVSAETGELLRENWRQGEGNRSGDAGRSSITFR